MADRNELPAVLRDDDQIVWSDRFTAWGTYAQGDAIFVTIDRATGPRVCDYYRRQMTDAAIGVSTHPACVDGLRAREIAAVNALADPRAQILRGRLRRAARVAGGLAMETPDVLTPDQIVALDRALADVERCLDRAALAVGVRVLP